MAAAKDSEQNFLDASMMTAPSKLKDNNSDDSDSFWDDCLLAESDSDVEVLDEKEEEYKTNSPKIFKKNTDVIEETPMANVKKINDENVENGSSSPAKFDVIYRSGSAGGLDAAIEADLETRLPVNVLTEEDEKVGVPQVTQSPE